MNMAHLHLIINHIPVIMFPAVFLLYIYALLLHDAKIKRLSLAVFLLTALATIPVYISGLRADEVLEGLKGVYDPAVDIHRDWALRSFVCAGFLGVFCLIVLLAYRSLAPLPGWTQTIAFLLALIVVILMTYTSYLGGHIRHPETNPNWKRPPESEETKKESRLPLPLVLPDGLEASHRSI